MRREKTDFLYLISIEIRQITFSCTIIVCCQLFNESELILCHITIIDSQNKLIFNVKNENQQSVSFSFVYAEEKLMLKYWKWYQNSRVDRFQLLLACLLQYIMSHMLSDKRDDCFSLIPSRRRMFGWSL
jgi:hypothetical protein